MTSILAPYVAAAQVTAGADQALDYGYPDPGYSDPGLSPGYPDPANPDSVGYPRCPDDVDPQAEVDCFPQNLPPGYTYQGGNGYPEYGGGEAGEGFDNLGFPFIPGSRPNINKISSIEVAVASQMSSVYRQADSTYSVLTMQYATQTDAASRALITSEINSLRTSYESRVYSIKTAASFSLFLAEAAAPTKTAGIAMGVVFGGAAVLANL